MADTDQTRRWISPPPRDDLTWHSGPAPTSGLAIALDRRQAISRQEHRDAVQRFRFVSAVAMLMNHLQQPPEPPSERLGHALPADLEAIVMRCLSKDPDDRPADAGELERALAACDDAVTR